MKEMKRSKLKRCCPKCKATQPHLARLSPYNATIGRRRLEVECVKCGHTWRGRFNRAEWTHSRGGKS